jgi:hypothetical protein
MAFVERLKIILDMDSNNAKTGLKSIGKEISNADGLTNKLKAGWKGASQSIAANIGAIAVTGGAALVAFGIKAVHAFENTAKAAVDMAAATGLSVEQASRWIAVGDDFKVSAESLTTALVRVGKNLDSAAFEKYGITATTTNGALLDVLDTINNTAPLERAAVGQELLGKGYKSLAPLLGKTRAEYEKMLASVEDGQVITASEAKKAERMRLAEDALADAVQEVTLAIGEQVAELGPLIEHMSDFVSLSTAIIPKADSVSDSIDSLGEAAAASGDAFKYLTERGYSSAAAVQIIADYRVKTEDATKATDALEAATKAEAAAAAAAGNKVDALAGYLEEQAKQAKAAADELWNAETAGYDVADAYAAMNEATAKSVELGKDEKATQAEKDQAYRDVRRSQIAVVEALAKQADAYAKEQGAADGSRASIMLQIAELNRQKALYPELGGMIDEYIAKLKRIPGVVTTNVGIHYGGGAGGTSVTGSGVSGDTGGVDVHNADPSKPSVNSVRGGAAPNVYVTVNTTGNGPEMIDAITAAVKDGVRAGWMATP